MGKGEVKEGGRVRFLKLKVYYYNILYDAWVIIEWFSQNLIFSALQQTYQQGVMNLTRRL